VAANRAEISPQPRPGAYEVFGVDTPISAADNARMRRKSARSPEGLAGRRGRLAALHGPFCPVGNHQTGGLPRALLPASPASQPTRLTPEISTVPPGPLFLTIEGSEGRRETTTRVATAFSPPLIPRWRRTRIESCGYPPAQAPRHAPLAEKSGNLVPGPAPHPRVRPARQLLPPAAPSCC